MTHEASIKREIVKAFAKYIHCYFYERNLEKTITMFSSSISGFGPGSDEKAFNFQQAQELYLKDFQQAPNPIEVDFLLFEISLLAENIGLIFSEINIKTKIKEIYVELENLRISAIFKKIKDSWLLEHQHISLPMSILQKEENYSFKKLQEKLEEKLEKELAETNILLAKMIANKTKESEEKLLRLEKLATTDKLTGVNNRTKFDEVINHTIEYIKRYKINSCLMLIDIDFFKNINDLYGHLIGDKVLKEVAQTINNNIRNVDTLARWGGEEFIIILPETNLPSAKKLAERIREIIYSHDFGINHQISISIGVTQYLDGDTADTWIQRTDDALYLAKRHGRNRVESV